jgi:hypothetical protein
MRYAQSLGLLIVLVLIVGCGGSSSHSLSGPWQFSLTSSAFPGNAYTGTTTLNQSASGISGTVAFANNPCASVALITGLISGSNVNLQITEGDQVVTLNGTVNSAFSSMSGTYTTTTGGCTNGDSGTWTASAI